MVLSLKTSHPIMTLCFIAVARESVETVKNFLNSASYVGSCSLFSTICSLEVGLTTTIEGSYLRSSARKLLMLATGLNFILARGGGKYAQIVQEWVLSARTFCSSVTLSLLDLLERVTILNGAPVISEDAMVESPESVIDLRRHT